MKKVNTFGKISQIVGQKNENAKYKTNMVCHADYLHPVVMFEVNTFRSEPRRPSVVYADNFSKLSLQLCLKTDRNSSLRSFFSYQQRRTLIFRFWYEVKLIIGSKYMAKFQSNVYPIQSRRIWTMFSSLTRNARLDHAYNRTNICVY